MSIRYFEPFLQNRRQPFLIVMSLKTLRHDPPKSHQRLPISKHKKNSVYNSCCTIRRYKRWFNVEPTPEALAQR